MCHVTLVVSLLSSLSFLLFPNRPSICPWFAGSVRDTIYHCVSSWQGGEAQGPCASLSTHQVAAPSGVQFFPCQRRPRSFPDAVTMPVCDTSCMRVTSQQSRNCGGNDGGAGIPLFRNAGGVMHGATRMRRSPYHQGGTNGGLDRQHLYIIKVINSLL